MISFLVGILTVMFSSERSIKENVKIGARLLFIASIVDEYRQYFIDGRDAEFLDAVWNLLGILAGICIPYIISVFISGRRQSYSFSYIRKRKRPPYFAIVAILMLIGLFFINEVPFF